MAHPCPASTPAAHPTLERTPHIDTVTLDALDAVELTEILEYFLERLDVLTDHDLAALHFNECSPYDIDDLRADVLRLIHRLNTSPFAT